MKVDVTSGGNSTAILEVTVDSSQVRESYDKSVKNAIKFVTVPGFRKGKAPRKLAEKELNVELIKQHIVEDLVSATLQKAVVEKEVQVVSSPDVEIVSFDLDGELVYKAVVDVMPEIELGNYDGFELQVEKPELKDESVERALENLREKSASFDELDEDRGLVMGDFALVDFDCIDDGKKVPQGSAANYQMELKEDAFIPGFVENIVGVKKGETKEFNITFPEDYPGALKGKNVVFKFTLHRIESKVLPEYNDEFAKKVSNFETMEELRLDIRKRMSDNIEARAASDAEAKVCERLAGMITAELPESMVLREQQKLMDRMAHTYSQYGVDIFKNLTDEQILKFAEDKRPEAEAKVKVELALNSIADKENIEVSDSDLDDKIREISVEIGQEFGKLKTNLKKNGRMESLRAVIRQDKALKHVSSLSSVTYIEPVDKGEQENADELED